MEAWFWWRWTHRRRPAVGVEALVGGLAETTEPCRPDGWARLHGELWRARCAAGVDAGEQVRVVAVDGLTLVVEPAEGAGASGRKLRGLSGVRLGARGKDAGSPGGGAEARAVPG